MSLNYPIPIYDNRTVIGYATNISSAIRFIRKTINVHPQFRVNVWRRTGAMQDILNLPDGFVYCIEYNVINNK
jgi:hypothetical protein